MLKYISFRFNVLAKMTLRDRISKWCKKNSDKFESYSALQMQEYNPRSGKIDSLKFKLIDRAKTLFDIMISENGVVNEELYKVAFPDNYSVFVNLLNVYFNFTNIIARAITHPNKYTNTYQFLGDWANYRGFFKLVNKRTELREAFNFLTNSPYYFNIYRISNNPTRNIIKQIDSLEKLYKNSMIILEIAQEYREHPLIRLSELNELGG